jgi:dimethylhistidine N-methyltransferase
VTAETIQKTSNSEIEFYDFHPEISDFHLEVLEGLRKEPKKISPKFFYDEAGSQLFEKICSLPEYYPTRTEQKILEENLDKIAAIVGKYPYIIEPGCGSCEKIKPLLKSLKPATYVPMDISREYLKETAQSLSDEFPWLEVQAACVDFTSPVDLSFCPENARKLAFFPGSSIGNFEPSQARNFLRHMLETVGPEGGMLIGVDLKKDIEILNKAYNDAAGVTADFNLNLLTRINNELNADFDLSSFGHKAFYNDKAGCVEMHLVSQKAQQIKIGDNYIDFRQGETIHTESSYKYTIEEFQKLGNDAGFLPLHVWTDDRNRFSVHYFEAPAC